MILSANSKPKKPLWLLDVDETLLTNHDGKFYYNENLITFLKENHITNITFLTKMDPSKVTSIIPLRINLIEHLAENDIVVDKVLTPQELLYEYDEIHSDRAYEFGSFYENYMRPLEEAIDKMRGAFSDPAKFQKCMQILTLRIMMGNIRLLKQIGIIARDTKLSDVEHLLLNGKEIKSDLHRQLSDFYMSGDSSSLSQQVDFGRLNELLAYVRAASIEEPDETISGLYVKIKEEHNELGKFLINEEKKGVYLSFVRQYVSYRNRAYIRLSALNFRVIDGELEESALHPSKGDVFLYLMRQDNKPNLVVLIDDSNRELTSVIEANKGSQIELVTTLPLESTYFDTQLGHRIDEFTFQQNTAKAVLVEALLHYSDMRELASGPLYFFKDLFSFDGNLKVGCARKLANLLQGEAVDVFSQLEMNALLQRESNLGNILAKYCKEYPEVLPAFIVESFNSRDAKYKKHQVGCCGIRAL